MAGAQPLMKGGLTKGTSPFVSLPGFHACLTPAVFATPSLHEGRDQGWEVHTTSGAQRHSLYIVKLHGLKERPHLTVPSASAEFWVWDMRGFGRFWS